MSTVQTVNQEQQRTSVVHRSSVAPGALLVTMTVVYINWAVNWWRTANEGFNGWAVGDWLISYDGGFVRRGLLGTIFLEVTPPDWSVIAVAVGVQIFVTGTLFVLIFLLYTRTDRSKTWAMAILSPAVLMYPTLVYGQFQDAPRKEILILTALAFVAVGFGTRFAAWTTLVGFLVFTIAIWSHEASVLLLPAFLYLVWRQIGQGPHSRWMVAFIPLFALNALIAGVASIASPGNVEIQRAICQAWADRGVIATCDGQALGSLTLTADGTVEWFATQLFPRYWEYLPVGALALIPLFTIRFFPQFWKVGALILAFIAPLFYLAWDYGRWIFLAATALTIVALALATATGYPRPMNVPLLAIIAYILLWGFPGYSGEPPVLFDGWLVTWLKTHIPTAWF